jgi:hypothetical protein
MDPKSISSPRGELSAKTGEVSIQAAELFTAAETLHARAEALGERVRLFREIVTLTGEIVAGRLYEMAETIGRWRPRPATEAEDPTASASRYLSSAKSRA